MRFYPASILPAAALVSSCVPNAGTERLWTGTETRHRSHEARAGHLLDIAYESAADLRRNAADETARLRYNKAIADLVVLLSGSGEDGLWNRPVTIAGAGCSYQMNFAGGSQNGTWDTGRFTRLVPASVVSSKYPANRHGNTGIGTAMVGIHAPDPLPPFYPPDGIAAPVTAVVGFEKSKVTLTLLDPVRIHAVENNEPGGEIAADPMAALDWYRKEPAWWNGLMGAIHVSRYMSYTGL